jgi:hypothetical protein
MNESQVTKLFNHLMTGARIDRVSAFNWYGIADLRSRISNVEKIYNVTIPRETKPGKRYLEYYLNPPYGNQK